MARLSMLRAAMPSSFSNILRRWLSQRHFFAGVAIPCFAVFVLVFGGFKNALILLRAARTTATITALHPGSRGSLYYSYEVDGHAYTGRGGPELPAFTAPFSVGGTFEVRYSKWFPFFSTARNPLTIFGQFAVGCLFLLYADYMATRYEKKRAANA